MLNTYKSLGFFPTPIHKLANLSEDFENEIYIKRDDNTGLGVGGNKTRKLEYLLQDAIDKGCETIITMGAAQSNHCRQTAAASAQYGLNCELLLRGLPKEELTGNLLLDQIYGAKIHYTEGMNSFANLQSLFDKLQFEEKKPYLIPVGGSNAIGSLGYVRAIKELKTQMDEQKLNFDHIVFATCSGGTHAGMLAGKELYGLNSNIIGINIDKEEFLGMPLENYIHSIGNEVLTILKSDFKIELESIIINNNYNKYPYGKVTGLEKKAISTLAKREGVLLDPVYSGRAFGGLLDLLSKDYFKMGEKILFWHTGGVPSVFHYAEELLT